MENNDLMQRDEFTPLARPLEQIEAEIIAHTQSVTSSFIVIGNDLIEAKARLSHGEWLPWLTDKIGFSARTAENAMRIAREVSATSPLAALPYTKVLALLELPAGEREEFAAENNATERSTAALRAAIKARDEARRKAQEEAERADKAQRAAQAYESELQAERRRKPEQVAVVPDDYDALKGQVEALRRRAEQAEDYAAEAEEELRAVQQEAQRAQMAQIDDDMREPEDPLALLNFVNACTALTVALHAAPLIPQYFAGKSDDDLNRYELMTSSVLEWANQTMKAIQGARQRFVVSFDEWSEDYEVK